MAFSTAQITPVANTATSLLAGFKIVGQIQDPLPVQFMVTSGTTYWGGPGVTTGNGFIMLANTPVVMNVYSNDIPFVISAAPVTVYVAVGRQ
jgi:hypothetical protein